MLKKIGLIGGGNIGGVLAQEIVRRKLASQVGLMDVKEPDLAKGKCLDVAEGTPIIPSDIGCEGARDYDVIEGAEIVINTAGVPRTKRPDGSIPTREELLQTNLQITDQVAAGIQKYCPEAVIISVANPLDAIVYRLYQNLNPPKSKLLGMAGVLDSSRYRYFVAQAARVSVENVEAMVLGGHGDTMVPVRSCCRIAGMPVDKFLDDGTLTELENRTRKAGGEIVGLMGIGSAFVSPAFSALEMVEAIAYDKRKILPCCVLLEGEYDVDGLFVGVPAVLGKGGVEDIIEVEMTDSEKEKFEHSVSAVQKTVDEVKAMG